MGVSQKHKKFLKEISIFSEASDEDLNQLAATVEELHLPKDTCIFNKGDVLDGMYLIMSGEVKVHDDHYVFTMLKDNDFFGEYSLIDSDVRSASVTTTKYSELLRIDHEIFGHFLQNKIELNRAILKALTKRLRETNVLEERLVQQKEEIELQRKALKELNATKDKFFAILAHDLRNPITTILGMADILNNSYNALSEKQKTTYIHSLQKYSNHVLELLNDLLNWAASTSGITKFEPLRIDLHKLFQDELKATKADALTAKIDLIVNMPQEVCVFADKNMVLTIFRNVIGNAIKFTHEGGRIEVSAVTQNDVVEIFISDTGIGMSEKDVGRLFKIEEDSSKIGTTDQLEMVKAKKGTGLGLILCKEFASKNGGDIRVKSKPGQGTTVVISLPMI